MNAPLPLPLLQGLLADSSPAVTGCAAEEAQQAFASRLSTLPVALARLDRRGTVLWCNKHFAEHCGVATSEVIGQPYARLRGLAEPASGEVCALRSAITQGQPHTGLHRLGPTSAPRGYRVTVDPDPDGQRLCLTELPHPLPVPPSDDSVAPLADRERERYQRIFECASAALLLMAEDGLVLACNPMAESMLGLPRGQIVGHVLHTLFRWDMRDLNWEPVPVDARPSNLALQHGLSTRNLIVNVNSADGRRRWISISTTPVPGDDGKTWAVSSFIDVSDRIEGERQRAEQWRQTQSIIEGSRLGLWHTQLDSSSLYMDEQCLQLMDIEPGLSPHQLMVRWAHALHPDDSPAVWEAVEQLSTGRQNFTIVQTRVRLRDGRWRWLRTRAHTVTQAHGSGGVTLAGTVEDISELKEHEAAARHSDALLQALFDQAPIGIQLVDLATGRTVRCNPARAEITGLSAEQIMSAPASERSGPDTFKRRVQWHHELLQQGHTGPHEFQLQHTGGQWRQVRFSAVRVTDPGGHPFAWALVQDITMAKALEEQLKSAATQDTLTGLPNRTAMLAHLDALLQRQREQPKEAFATLFLDFDRFKLVNDTLGHAVGDQLLCAIAERLRTALPQRPGWMAARFGGDEFVVVMPGAPSAAEVEGFAHQLMAAFRPPHLIGGHELLSTASIGVAMATESTSDSQTLLREADTAMYEAKRRGRSQVVFYDAAMHARLHRSVQLEAGLRTAIERGELHVVYQPIVDLQDRRMASAEALLRWTHTTLGAISPAEFIPIAEESGHILALGEWVLRQACQTWIRWHQQDPRRCPQTVSVNLSRVQLQLGERLVDLVRKVLEDTGMPAHHLQLEVTEREVMLKQSDMAALLRQLHGLGIRLAMDDFGTGASSLGCLRDFPFDVIKIDKSFMADLSSDAHALAIAQATIQVIETLGMQSVAEGVENLQDVTTLQAMGCRFGQGYLFCRPVRGEVLLDSVELSAG